MERDARMLWSAGLLLGLSACGGGSGGGSDSGAQLELGAALPEGDRVGFTAARARLSEADRLLEVPVQRIGSATGPFRASYRIEAGEAVAGEDYIAGEGTLEWDAGDLSPRSISVEVLSDLEVENEETFRLVLEPLEGDDLIDVNHSLEVILSDAPCATVSNALLNQSATLSGPCHYWPSGLLLTDSAVLQAAPGTTMIFGAGTALDVMDSARLELRGSEARPIRLQGDVSMAGSWRGVTLQSTGDAHQFDQVSIRDAEVGVDLLRDATPAVIGHLAIDQSLTAAVSLPLKHAALAGSVCVSRSPGGVAIVNERVTTDEPVEIPAIGSYYQVRESLIVDGALTLAAGVEMRMARGSQIFISQQGSLHAVGTADQPIRLIGQEALAGHWDGLLYDNSSSASNRLEQVVVAHGGRNRDRPGNISVTGTQAQLTVREATVRDSAGYGLWISDPADIRVETTEFSDNMRGDRYPENL